MFISTWLLTLSVKISRNITHLARKDIIDVNVHERLFNITLRHMQAGSINVTFLYNCSGYPHPSPQNDNFNLLVQIKFLNLFS